MGGGGGGGGSKGGWGHLWIDSCPPGSAIRVVVAC